MLAKSVVRIASNVTKSDTRATSCLVQIQIYLQRHEKTVRSWLLSGFMEGCTLYSAPTLIRECLVRNTTAPSQTCRWKHQAADKISDLSTVTHTHDSQSHRFTTYHPRMYDALQRGTTLT